MAFGQTRPLPKPAGRLGSPNFRERLLGHPVRPFIAMRGPCCNKWGQRIPANITCVSASAMREKHRCLPGPSPSSSSRACRRLMSPARSMCSSRPIATSPPPTATRSFSSPRRSSQSARRTARASSRIGAWKTRKRAFPSSSSPAAKCCTPGCGRAMRHWPGWFRPRNAPTSMDRSARGRSPSAMPG